MVDFLLSSHADVNAKSAQKHDALNDTGLTALMIACQHTDRCIVKSLLKANADTNLGITVLKVLVFSIASPCDISSPVLFL